MPRCHRAYRRDYWDPAAWPCRGLVREGHRPRRTPPVSTSTASAFARCMVSAARRRRYDICNDNTDRPLIILYVGDYDPSGMYMSKCDLPARFFKYGGDHITLKRIALTSAGRRPAVVSGDDKKKDPRYKWFVKHYGKKCWELDALDPNDLRDIVERPFGKRSSRWPGNAARSLRGGKGILATVLDRWGAS